ncbi:MAG: DUF2958 domain-containing protein [Rikenellaceae bacterium]
MKLLTDKIELALRKNPLNSQDGKGIDTKLIVKYFNPIGSGTWLITEGEQLENGDWELFGLCYIFEWEWGNVMLSELQSISFPFGLGIERDEFAEKTVREQLIVDGEDEYVAMYNSWRK